jgi:quercetin dioxygenase-like cupin family protein
MMEIDVPVVHHDDVPREVFRDGMTYQTLVGDERGSTPVRVGIQTSAPGTKTPLHSHPYMEILTVLEGQGEAWIEGTDDLFALSPGTTLVLPANVKHWFQAKGEKALITYGIHASPRRIVNVHEVDRE